MALALAACCYHHHHNHLSSPPPLSPHCFPPLPAPLLSLLTWPLLLLLAAAATAVHTVRLGATASASRLPDLAGATCVGDLRRRRLSRAPALVPTNEDDDDIAMAFCIMAALSLALSCPRRFLPVALYTHAHCSFQPAPPASASTFAFAFATPRPLPPRAALGSQPQSAHTSSFS